MTLGLGLPRSPPPDHHLDNSLGISPFDFPRSGRSDRLLAASERLGHTKLLGCGDGDREYLAFCKAYCRWHSQHVGRDHPTCVKDLHRLLDTLFPSVVQNLPSAFVHLELSLGDFERQRIRNFPIDRWTAVLHFMLKRESLCVANIRTAREGRLSLPPPQLPPVMLLLPNKRIARAA